MIARGGIGLHTGRPGRVTISAGEGPVVLRTSEGSAPIAELEVIATARSTTVATGDRRVVVATVEHLFAALAGAGIDEGLVLTIDGPEVPLLDGGAAAFFDAIMAVVGDARRVVGRDADALPPRRPRLTIATAGEIVVGESRYRFEPVRPEAPHACRLEVAVDFNDARLAPSAVWEGDAVDFRARIAPARTFGFAHELGELAAKGLAAHVDPESAVLVTPEGILASGRAFTPDEPARHKLLDLMGDLYVHGGPPRGSVHATRPGHGATREAVRRAVEEGLVERTRST